MRRSPRVDDPLQGLVLPEPRTQEVETDDPGSFLRARIRFTVAGASRLPGVSGPPTTTVRPSRWAGR
ncbi:hypothetical protein, partial [Streptomyces sp. NPDC001774]